MYTGLFDSLFFDSLVFVIPCFPFFVLKTFLPVVYSTGIPFRSCFDTATRHFLSSYHLGCQQLSSALTSPGISRHLFSWLDPFRPRTWTYLYISVYLISSQRTPFQASEVYREKKFLKLWVV